MCAGHGDMRLQPVRRLQVTVEPGILWPVISNKSAASRHVDDVHRYASNEARVPGGSR